MEHLKKDVFWMNLKAVNLIDIKNNDKIKKHHFKAFKLSA